LASRRKNFPRHCLPEIRMQMKPEAMALIPNCGNLDGYFVVLLPTIGNSGDVAQWRRDHPLNLERCLLSSGEDCWMRRFTFPLSQTSTPAQRLSSTAHALTRSQRRPKGVLPGGLGHASSTIVEVCAVMRVLFSLHNLDRTPQRGGL
jgi:hypothetical protein